MLPFRFQTFLFLMFSLCLPHYALSMTVVDHGKYTTSAAAATACNAMVNGSGITKSGTNHCNAGQAADVTFWGGTGTNIHATYRSDLNRWDGNGGVCSAGSSIITCHVYRIGTCPTDYVENPTTGLCEYVEPLPPNDCGIGFYNVDGGTTSASCEPYDPPPGCQNPLGYLNGKLLCGDDAVGCGATGGYWGSINDVFVCVPSYDDGPSCSSGKYVVVKTGDDSYTCESLNPNPPGNSGDSDGDGTPNGSDSDMDGDGTPNGSDSDMDGDGRPNGSDSDMDGDGRPNGSDGDTDGDGDPNWNDDDDDNDGTDDADDSDDDNDGDPDPDSDNDGDPDDTDSDDDNDGDPDTTDTDDNGDGADDVDSDGDGDNDDVDGDDDNDGVPDEEDEDSDGDGAGDCDPTATNYLECVGGDDELTDEQKQNLINDYEFRLDGDLALYAQELDDLQSSEDGELEVPSTLIDKATNWTIFGVTCVDSTFTIHGGEFTVTCERTQLFRDMVGFAVFFMTVLSIWNIAIGTSPGKGSAT